MANFATLLAYTIVLLLLSILASFLTIFVTIISKCLAFIDIKTIDQLFGILFKPMCIELVTLTNVAKTKPNVFKNGKKSLLMSKV